MCDLRNELITYSKDQLIELQNLLLMKTKRIKTKMCMTASPDKYVSYSYTKTMAELAITREILKSKEKQC